VSVFSLTKTYDYERYGVPFRSGKKWYYSYNEGLRPQSVYYTVDGDAIESSEKGTVFFDPNTLSDDGTLAVQPLL
jgi:prolyl oligopeptidase